jgi:hypothetical protein
MMKVTTRTGREQEYGEERVGYWVVGAWAWGVGDGDGNVNGRWEDGRWEMTIVRLGDG